MSKKANTIKLQLEDKVVKKPAKENKPVAKEEEIKDHGFDEYQKDKTIYSEDEKAAWLIGYDLVPREDWINLKPSAHIRYEKSDGGMARGGFIKNQFKSTKTGQRGLYIVNGKDRNAHGWAIIFDSITKIWKKRTADDVKIANIEEKIIHTNAETMNIESRLELLELENKQLKLDIQNILKWIKRQRESTNQMQNQPQRVAISNNTKPKYVV